MYLSGTSEVLGLISPEKRPDRGRHRLSRLPAASPCTRRRPSPAADRSAGSRRSSAATPKAIADLVSATPRATSVPLFLPHLEGERAPLWDSKARGVFARLETATGPGELSRSVLEGVAFSARLAFAALEASANLQVDALHLGGGGARSDVWCQIRADVLGKVLRRVSVLDAGTLGAAIIAGVGSGVMPDLAAASGRLVRFDRTFEPDASARDYYDTRFEKYRELYADLKSFNAGYD